MSYLYCTTEDVRKILGLDIDDAPNDKLEWYVERAHKEIIKYVQIPIVNEEMSGNIDGKNSTFSADNGFIADTNWDKTISTLDFTIYGWTDADDEFTKVALPCSTFDAVTGKFILSSAPGTTYKKITIDYSYYTRKIDWNIMEEATMWLAAKKWINREILLSWEDVKIGDLHLKDRKVIENVEKEFNRQISLLIAIQMSKVDYEKMVINPRGVGTKGTTLEEMGLT